MDIFDDVQSSLGEYYANFMRTVAGVISITVKPSGSLYSQSCDILGNSYCSTAVNVGQRLKLSARNAGYLAILAKEKILDLESKKFSNILNGPLKSSLPAYRQLARVASIEIAGGGLNSDVAKFISEIQESDRRVKALMAIR